MSGCLLLAYHLFSSFRLLVSFHSASFAALRIYHQRFIDSITFKCAIFIEHLHFQVRTFGMIIVSSSVSIFSFTSLKLLPILMEAIDLYGCMMIYGTGCIIGAFFVLFVLEETSGQSLMDSTPFADDRSPLIFVPEIKSNIKHYQTFNIQQ